MNVEEILNSPEISIFDSSKFEEIKESKIINQSKYKETIALAENIGLFNLFRKQFPNSYSISLSFFRELYDLTNDKDDLELYRNYVESFEWSKNDNKYSIYFNHWIFLCKKLRGTKYLNKVRYYIDSAFSFTPDPEDIQEEIISNRRSDITHNILFGKSKREIEEAKINAFKEPTDKEIKEVVRRLCSFKLSRAFESASKLYAISEEAEDLSRAVDSYNRYFECENESEHPNFFFNAKRGLELLLRTSRRNDIREEYKRRALEEGEEDWMVGTAFSDLKDLFLMTKLREDKNKVDEFIDRGIDLLKKGVSTNFANYIEKLFELFKFSGDRSYLDKYESIISMRRGKKIHPAHIGDNPLVIFPIFEITRDAKYIPIIERYCKSSIEKHEYRTAEHFYFRIFELTGDKKYFDRAREIRDTFKDEVSEEKKLLDSKILLKSLNKVLKAHAETSEILKEERTESFATNPPLEFLNEVEVSSRISYNINNYVKYLKYYYDLNDVDDLRKNISILEEMSHGKMMVLGNLLDLYQITGDVMDLNMIKDSFQNYVRTEHDLFENKIVLEVLGRREF